MKIIKILIADDINAIAKKISNDISKVEGTEVVGIANNGKEEYDKILELQPDLVFTDNQMPEMTGMEVIEKIKNTNIENKPEFVLVTGDSNFEIMNKAYDLGVVTIIRKPVDSERIAEAIMEYRTIIDSKE